MVGFMGRKEIKKLQKEGLTLKEIAARVGLHRNTVARLLKEPAGREYRRPERGDAASPYEEKILGWIQGGVPVERMLELVNEQKDSPYKGSRSAFYAGVARIRKQADLAKAERFVRFEGLPGEYAQVDWGEVRNFPFQRQEPSTRYFLAVRLKFSRFMFVKWCDSMRLEVLLRGLLEAFEAFGGVPWVLVFDNMKTVTTGRDDQDQPIWHPVFKKFADELDFKPEACDRGLANQKGAVENLVGWVKSSFLPGRHFLDDEDLHRQAGQWSYRTNHERASRAHGEIPGQLLPAEQMAMGSLAESAEEYGLFQQVTADREGRVWFEGTRHQMPIGLAEKAVILRVRRSRLDFYDAGRLVVSYPRPSGAAGGRRLAPFEPELLEPLLKIKPRARVMVYRDYLMQQHPALAAYVVGVCSRHRGDEEFGPHVLGMFDLLRLHGLEAVAAACTLAADEKAYGVDYVESLLEPPTSRPVGRKLEVPGVPTQSDVERAMAVYEAYAVQGGGSYDA